MAATVGATRAMEAAFAKALKGFRVWPPVRSTGGRRRLARAA